MAGISLGGLASGLDTQSVIDQLMAVDRQPETRLKLNQSALQARQSTLGDIATRLRNLLGAAKDLGGVATWADTQSLDISDATKLTATRLGGAAPGGHEIVVSNLARAEQRSYSFTPGAATLNIGGTQVQLSAADDGQAAADKINAAPGSPVYAVWVKDPLGDPAKDQLVLTRKDTGSFQQGDMTVDGASWTATETFKTGVNATFSVDGGPVQQSRSNVVTSAIPGVQLTLKATGTTSVTVGVPGPDNDAVRAKVQAFVDQYNSTIDFIRGKLSEKRVPNATSDTDARQGVLFADTQLTGLLAQMRSMVSQKTGIGGAIASFGDLGVSTGTASGGASNADALAGKLTIDDAKLTDALENHRLDLKGFLTDPANGISAKLSGLLDPVARSGGLIDVRAQQAGDQSKDIDDQIAQMETRLSQKADRLKAQFTAMEQALAQSQSQSSWLASQLK